MTKNDMENRGIDEAASVGRGAYKAARLAKATSKGAAAGGIWGAAAGAAWEGRKHIGKLLAATAVLLMLPVLFILMLPALIFGGLTTSRAEGAEQPVLNDAAAVTQNITDTTYAINQVLGEGIDDVTTRIATHFAETDGDNYEIVNPYEGNLVSNANIFLGEYCAAKNTDWKSISKDDLERILRDGKDQLYAFTFTSEERTVEADDPETPDVVETKTEKLYVYTISYNGEQYFADAVFHLTDEQKALADDYAQNLSLFLGDGVFQGIFSDEATAGIPSLGDVRFTDGVTEVVYYNQMDERYANKPYGTDDVGHYGCGPASMAIVVSSLTDDMVDPAQMAKWAYEHGYWCSKSGSYRSLIPGAAKAWGLTVEGCGKNEAQRIVDALSEGKLVVAIMSKGHFTEHGHFIVLRGVKDGKIMVADPASRSRSGQLWDLSLIVKEASSNTSDGGPFWIIGRQ